MRPISRSELARLAGVSPAAITKLSRGSLADAVTEDGRIDLDADCVAEYLRKKGIDPTAPENLAFSRRRKLTAVPDPEPDLDEDPDDSDDDSDDDSEDDSGDDEEPDDDDEDDGQVVKRRQVAGPPDVTFEEIADLTVREVVDRFGTSSSLVDYTQALKIIEQTRWQRIKNEREEGRLIPKEYVKAHVLSVIDGAFRGLLIDAPKTLARRLYGAARADVTIEEGEQIAKDINGSHIRNVKDRCRKALKDDGD